ncbi:MAG: tRNA-dihydrouridine synthase [Clostridiales bacterium]|nr:tRNA-dihydrouridine synthase [Clostridiales bacterium]
MLLKKLEVGGLKIKNNLLLAPLAGYTNAVFRGMCESLGAGLTFTEMVSAKGLCYNSENTRGLLVLTPGYGAINAVQLFGSEPEYMQRAAQSEDIAPFDLIDINMGCPVPKIFKNGEGSALLANIPLAQKLVKAAKRSGKPVSVKFRTGIDGEHIVTRDFALAMRDAGADMITVHGRTRDKMYSGGVNYKEIASAKAAVDIPVIANGGIFCNADAEKLLNETGADGVMVARGAMYNPFIFAEICGTPVPDKKAVIQKQLSETFAKYDARFAAVYMRKMLAFYIKGQPNAAAIRVKLMSCTRKEQIEEVLENLNF